jgi:hypothetical protein
MAREASEQGPPQKRPSGRAGGFEGVEGALPLAACKMQRVGSTSTWQCEDAGWALTERMTRKGRQPGLAAQVRGEMPGSCRLEPKSGQPPSTTTGRRDESPQQASSKQPIRYAHAKELSGVRARLPSLFLRDVMGCGIACGWHEFWRHGWGGWDRVREGIACGIGGWESKAWATTMGSVDTLLSLSLSLSPLLPTMLFSFLGDRRQGG